MLILLVRTACCLAQERSEIYIQGRLYLDLNISSLNKYSRRIERTQVRLLNKLKRRENRLAKKLLHTDSVAYARLKSQPLNFDSISKLAVHPDSTTMASQAVKGGRKAVDSLKGVYKFLQAKEQSITSNKTLSTIARLTGYGDELSVLQGRLSYNQYITDLTSKYASNLQNIAGKNASTGIEKELFYAKAKMSEWKKLADNPSALEEKALEYLQGTKGFDVTMNTALNGTANSNRATSVDELEQMGYQTKRQLNSALEQKFGNNLQALQGKVSKEVGQWQGKAQGLQNQFKESRQSLSSLKHIGKPSFNVNPMRGLPFWQRLEKQYSFNTARASTTVDGNSKPAILSLSAGLAYRQTPKLSAGIGIAGDIGLGQNWSAIKVTFQGIGLRAFITWKLQYGIGAYGGYERVFKQYAFKDNGDKLTTVLQSSVHSTDKYSESVLLGLTKKYKINSKWNGAVQVLFDVWWRDKGLRSPIVLRFQNSK